MENEDPMLKSFGTMDNNDLAMILDNVGQQILSLRNSVPDMHYWWSTLKRLSKMLRQSPNLDKEEQRLILREGWFKAVVHMKERTGMRFQAVKHIIEDWMEKNGIEK